MWHGCFSGTIFYCEYFMQISVIGLGKLGSPLAAVLAHGGHEVIGVDLNLEFVRKINEGIAPVQEPGLQDLLTQNKSRIRATSSCELAVLNSAVTFVIVPTPSQENGFFSNRYLIDAIRQLGQALLKKSSYHLVVITSTVMPGSIQGEIRKALENYRPVGTDLGLCYHPEFIALGSVIKNMLFPDMILIGESDQKAGDLLEEICMSICADKKAVCRMNIVNAEITKIAINTFVTTKISYANMISDICQQIDGADSDVVTCAMGLDSRIGPKYLKGAVGFGGPCFPRDNVALEALADDCGARADIAHASQAINHYQMIRLSALVEKYAPNHQISVLGLAYKTGTSVIDESQGIHIANHLQNLGYSVAVYDPLALVEAQKELLPGIYIASSVQECVNRSETILIMIPEMAFKEMVLLKGPKKVIIDCWRILPPEFSEYCNLVYLGRKNNHLLEMAESLCGQGAYDV